jgi:pyrroline-5-carboxylate reductase
LLIIDTHAATAPKAPYPITIYPTLDALPSGITPSMIALATKPNHLSDVLTALNETFVAAAPLIFSVAAGKPLSFYASHLWDDASIIRVMPNTPAMIGEGMSVCIGNAHVSQNETDLIDQLMRTVGDVLWITDESQMDAVTALSGSGPAYLFYFLECLIEGAQKIGLNESQAIQLAKQTMLGAARLAKAETSPISQLRNNVTSPNGTTHAALQVLMGKASGDFKQIIAEALQAAQTRSIELAQ